MLAQERLDARPGFRSYPNELDGLVGELGDEIVPKPDYLGVRGNSGEELQNGVTADKAAVVLGEIGGVDCLAPVNLGSIIASLYVSLVLSRHSGHCKNNKE
jgi:hypothetical protein